MNMEGDLKDGKVTKGWNSGGCIVDGVMKVVRQ